MNRVYEKNKGSLINRNGYSGVLCGYTDTDFIIAITEKPIYSFRRLPKGAFIEEEFKDTKYRYTFADEKEF